MILESKIVFDWSIEDLVEWCGGTIVIEHDALDHAVTQRGINVPCQHDEVKRASLGDTITRHDDGTFDVVKT